jgi:hypothetical protein
MIITGLQEWIMRKMKMKIMMVLLMMNYNNDNDNNNDEGKYDKINPDEIEGIAYNPTRINQ